MEIQTFRSLILFWWTAVAKETEFEFWGFVLVMLAAVMSGFRWCMTQILLQVLYLPFLSIIYSISTCLFTHKHTQALSHYFSTALN